MMVNIYMLKQEFEQAAKHAETIIRHNGKDRFYYAALYYRAYCMKQLGRTEDAEKYYKEAISLYRLATLNNAKTFDAYIYRSMCLRDIEEYDKALELLELMENISPNIAEIYTLRADVYKLMGKELLMKEALEHAYELKPELKERLQVN